MTLLFHLIAINFLGDLLNLFVQSLVVITALLLSLNQQIDIQPPPDQTGIILLLAIDGFLPQSHLNLTFDVILQNVGSSFFGFTVNGIGEVEDGKLVELYAGGFSTLAAVFLGEGEMPEGVGGWASDTERFLVLLDA